MAEEPITLEVNDPLAELNQAVPVGKLLNPKIAEDAKTLSGFRAISIFRESPTQQAECEMLIGKIAVTALNSGNWLDIPIQGDYQPLVDVGFVNVVKAQDGSEMLRPTEALAKFVQDRFKPWAPKE